MKPTEKQKEKDFSIENFYDEIEKNRTGIVVIATIAIETDGTVKTVCLNMNIKEIEATINGEDDPPPPKELIDILIKIKKLFRKNKRLRPLILCICFEKTSSIVALMNPKKEPFCGFFRKKTALALLEKYMKDQN